MKDAERVNEIMAQLGIKSVTKFAQSIGRNRPDAIYNVLNGQAMSDYLARDIASYHKMFRYEWVRYGRGEMLLRPDEIKEIPGSVKTCEYCQVKDIMITNLLKIIDEQRKIIDEKSR